MSGPKVSTASKPAQQTVQPRITSLANTVVDLQDVGIASAPNVAPNPDIGFMDASFGAVNSGVIAGGNPPGKTTMTVDLGNQPVPTVANTNTLNGLKTTSAMPSANAPPIMGSVGQTAGISGDLPLPVNTPTQGPVAAAPANFGKLSNFIVHT